MQILHGFAGSIQRVVPERCHFSGTTPSAPRKSFSSTIRVRRYLCCCGKRAVSLLPEFVLPYLRYGIVVIALYLVARLLLDLPLKAAAALAGRPPYVSRLRDWDTASAYTSEYPIPLQSLFSTNPSSRWARSWQTCRKRS